MKLNDLKKPLRERIKRDNPALATRAPKRVLARVRVRPTTDELGLNRTERAWLTVLEAQPAKYVRVRTHPITFKLADDTRYTPDFQTTDAAGEIIIWEVKGFWRDDAKVKIKLAAREFTEFKFVVVQKQGKGWITTEVKP